jgi:hypothetical protein
LRCRWLPVEPDCCRGHGLYIVAGRILIAIGQGATFNVSPTLEPGTAIRWRLRRSPEFEAWKGRIGA